jgi:DNA repair exonuclease SbcCD ATPase subunit
MTDDSSLFNYRQHLDEFLTQRRAATQQIREEKEALAKAEEHLTHIQEAQTILQHVAQSVQHQAHERIASVVSRCLAAVFGDEAYQFVIHFERKRGRTEARLVFVRDGHEFHPTSGSGGGVLDVASFALRLACLLLRKPAPRRLLVADEPMKNVHGEENRLRTREMLETLAEEMDFQMVLVTGSEWLQCGKVINLDKIE